MTEHEASRTLVKSPPELWAELSDESSLERHFDQFGEIRITRLEPETAVAWEGERVSGTVRLEPSGWGTKVILTARAARVDEARADEEAVADEAPEVVTDPAHEAPAPPVPLPRPVPYPELLPPAPASSRALPASRVKEGVFGRLFGFLGGPRPQPGAAVEPPVAALEPVAQVPEPVAPEGAVSAESEPEPTAEVAGVLAAALDSLGQAHHRPFSRG